MTHPTLRRAVLISFVGIGIVAVIVFSGMLRRNIENLQALHLALAPQPDIGVCPQLATLRRASSYLVGRAALEIDCPQQAGESLTMASAQTLGDAERLLVNAALAEFYYRREQPEQAREYLHWLVVRAVTLPSFKIEWRVMQHNDETLSLIQTAETALTRGDWPEALRAAQTLETLDSGNYLADHLAKRAYVGMGETDRVQELLPDLSLVRYTGDPRVDSRVRAAAQEVWYDLVEERPPPTVETFSRVAHWLAWRQGLEGATELVHHAAQSLAGYPEWQTLALEPGQLAPAVPPLSLIRGPAAELGRQWGLDAEQVVLGQDLLGDDLASGWVWYPMEGIMPFGRFDRAFFDGGLDGGSGCTGPPSLRVDGLWLIRDDPMAEPARAGFYRSVHLRDPGSYLLYLCYRTELSTPTAVAGVYVRVRDFQMEPMLPATLGTWRSYVLPLDVEHEDTSMELILRLWQPGRVWFDDIQLHHVLAPADHASLAGDSS